MTMPIQTRLACFVRLAIRRAARPRRAALAIAFTAALVSASASTAMAAPITLSYPLDLFPSPVARFDTTLGTLLSVDITFSTVLGAINPFGSQPPNADTCSAAFSGGSITISAPGTPTLLTLDGLATTSANCGIFEFGVSKQGAATVDPAYFGAFSSVGPSPITMHVTVVAGTATVTRGSTTQTTDSYWHPGLTHGTLAYTYCPVGEECPTSPPPPPPPTVPEPATLATLTLGLASLLARRRSPAEQPHPRGLEAHRNR